MVMIKTETMYLILLFISLGLCNVLSFYLLKSSKRWKEIVDEMQIGWDKSIKARQDEYDLLQEEYRKLYEDYRILLKDCDDGK